jgi:hypothetical protein
MLPALVGAGVPCLTGWGEVVSVYPQAVNVRHGQGLLVSFIREIRSMTSMSICLPALFRKQKNGLVPGDRVRFDGHRLVTEDFVVDLLGRPTWQGTLTRDDVKGFGASKISLLKEALLLKGRGGGFLGLLRRDEANNPFVDNALKVLREIQSSPSRAGRLKVLSGLVGLGPGSTPSGDDFITGVLMGEEISRLLLSAEAKAVASDQRNMVACAIDKENLRVVMNRTNDAGKTLLWQALQGHFPEYLIETVRSVSHAKGKQEIVDAVQRAVGRGATSGTDALTGFVFCFEGDPHGLSHPFQKAKLLRL